MRTLFLFVLICSSCEYREKTICEKLMDERDNQTLNNRPAESIRLTDSMLIRCNCAKGGIATLSSDTIINNVIYSFDSTNVKREYEK